MEIESWQNSPNDGFFRSSLIGGIGDPLGFLLSQHRGPDAQDQA